MVLRTVSPIVRFTFFGLAPVTGVAAGLGLGGPTGLFADTADGLFPTPRDALAAMARRTESPMFMIYPL